MYSALIFLHVAVCLVLIMIVLLQTGKGADMGSAFGGGSSQTLFGASGPQSFLGKITTVAAIVFMLTSLSLAALSSKVRINTIIPEQTTTAPAPIQSEQPAKTVGDDEADRSE